LINAAYHWSFSVPDKEISELDSQFTANQNQAPPETIPGALFHVLSFSLVRLYLMPHPRILTTPRIVTHAKRKATWSCADQSTLSAEGLLMRVERLVTIGNFFVNAGCKTPHKMAPSSSRPQNQNF
jgi:hypothetical protein